MLQSVTWEGALRMYKFEQVSSISDQISLAAGPCTVRSHVQRRGGQGWGQEGPCTVRSNVQRRSDQGWEVPVWLGPMHHG